MALADSLGISDSAIVSLVENVGVGEAIAITELVAAIAKALVTSVHVEYSVSKALTVSCSNFVSFPVEYSIERAISVSRNTHVAFTVQFAIEKPLTVFCEVSKC